MSRPGPVDTNLEALVARAKRELIEANAGLTPAKSSRLVAGLANRLAQEGEVEKVSLSIRGTRRAAEMVLSFVAKWPLEDAPERPLHASRTLPDDGEHPDPAQDSSTASKTVSGAGSQPQESPPARRTCGFCGASFIVSRRHARIHKYCSASCRSRARHRRNRRQPDLCGPVVGCDAQPESAT